MLPAGTCFPFEIKGKQFPGSIPLKISERLSEIHLSHLSRSLIDFFQCLLFASSLCLPYGSAIENRNLSFSPMSGNPWEWQATYILIGFTPPQIDVSRLVEHDTELTGT